jgi:hypothetical protein
MPRSRAHVTLTGRPILGVHAGWQLFARAEDSLVVIALAKGKVTRTEVPGLQSGNAVSFVIGPHEAVIRSYDYVPGYLIPDGGQARQLTGALSGGGPLIQGPVPGEAWQFASRSSNAPLVLMALAGHRVGPAIRLGNGVLAVTVTSDGRGDILVLTDAGQWYDAGPGWYRRVGGQVIAIGPGRWLMLACQHGRHCRNELVDPVDGAVRTIPGRPLRSAVHFWPPAGAISPDGSAAAVIETGRTSLVHLVTLSSGADARLALAATDQPAAGSMAWSPDGRWLFVALNGDLFAVDAQNDRVTRLDVSLPPISQLAVRPAPG